MVGRLAITLLIFLSLIQLASAANIQEVNLVLSEEDPVQVQYLAPNKVLETQVEVIVTGDTIADCRPQGQQPCTAILNINSESQGNFPFEDHCTRNDTRLKCYLPYELSTQDITEDNETKNLNYQIISQRGDAELAPTNTGSFTITIDRTTPVLSKLETGFCQEDKCYVGSNTQTTLRAEFEDELTNFEHRLVMFEVENTAGEPFGQLAKRCGTNWCEAEVFTPSCNNEDPVRVRVVDLIAGSPSQEDARNPIEDNGLELIATCDSEPPEVSDDDVRLVSRGSVPHIYETANPLTIEATAQDMPGGRITLLVISDNLTTQEETTINCSETNQGEFVCEGDISNLNAGTHDIDLVFVDGAGNEEIITREVQVLETVEEEGETDFITLNVNQITPDPINRVALQLAMENTVNYPVIIDYTLTPKEQGVNVVSQSLQNLDCAWSEQPITEESENLTFNPFSRDRSSILNPRADLEEPNRLSLNFRSGSVEFPDTVYFRCEYDVYVTKDDRFFTNSEREEFEFSLGFRNTPLGQPGEAFVSEIERGEERITGTYQKTLRNLEQVGEIADQFCSIFGILGAVESAGAAVTSIGKAIPIPALGEAIEITGNNIYKPPQTVLASLSDQGASSDRVNAFFSALGVSEYSIRGFCDAWLCTGAHEAQGWWGDEGGMCGSVNDWMGEQAGEVTVQSAQLDEDGDRLRDADGNFETEDVDVDAVEFSVTGGDYCVPDYSESLFASLGIYGGGVCVKGVIYNLGKWEAIECGYVSCLKEQAAQGANVNICKQGKSYKECTQVYGEISQFPLVNVFTRTSALINQRIQDAPLDLLLTAGGGFCSQSTTAVDALKGELFELALSVVTNGYYDAIKEVMIMAQNLANMMPFISIGKAGVTEPVGMPTLGPDANFVCHLMNAFYHISDFQRLQSGAVGGMQLGESRALCEAALCDGPDCDRGAVVSGWLSQVAGYSELLAQQRAARDGDPFHQQHIQGLAAVYGDASEQIARQKIAEARDDSSDDLSDDEIIAHINEYNRVTADIEPDGRPLVADFLHGTHGYSEDFADSIGSVVSGLEETSSNDVIMRRVTGDDTDVIRVTVVDGDDDDVSVDVDMDDLHPRTQDFINQRFEDDDGMSAADYSALVQAENECLESCSEQEFEQAVTTAEASQDVVPLSELSQDVKVEAGSTLDLLDEYRELRDSPEPLTEKGREEKEQELQELRVRIGMSCNSLDRCDSENIDWDAETVDIDGDTVSFAEMTEEARQQQEFYRLGSTFIAQWVKDQGYLDNLKLSAFGSWGADRAAAAEKLWSPDAWISNACSTEWETDQGVQEPFVGSDPLHALGGGVGPVLTLAGEVRQLDNGTNIYTVSYYIKSEESNTVWLRGRPGDETIGLGGEDNGGTLLTPNEPLQDSFSFESTTHYDEFCAVFANRFPDATHHTGSQTFCRPFQEDAYERGGMI